MATLLMCNPLFYDVTYSINPWMRPTEVPTDRSLAQRQWDQLVQTFTDLGVRVEVIPGRANLPDMVFTANAGLVSGKRVVLARFKHPERQPERHFFGDWFATHGYTIVDFLDDHSWEGAGDSLVGAAPNGQPEYLYLGHDFRSDWQAVTHPGWRTFLPTHRVYPLKLVDPYFYHLDTCFCPLQRGIALIYPPAFLPEQIACLEQEHGLTLLKVPEADARKFACNAVCVDHSVVIPAGCGATRELLRSAGFEAIETPVTEFIKAGGACKCLTLRLE
ncbi:dimethylarginine dimethylaminohydrolase family protein [Tuwongella immobilis]|uniref:Amidinotransferase n=1 Tax=Tuwongella immobilis TaxID=692036 RepID=A0A6C2YGQ6_9BACT|nr:arginine deiminase-related protein [Tuwongella immobilis]VIP00710.1 Amidinotransferase OS=Pirellula staleyi (strain ATCC 27377 / DSM 6068 / ICPB 4128) GN=Psta_3749 PE=4 SV=1: Amidinotransf [Tuwongella immobilis]VTR96838.1 Amidinotransferase OS=Pirellula staleyi (strain ATCC 27377 / DSM 6068 / ICPB 4128) GN=Psta_3749 PE=4 SV=1: Amidinotransf [Tuwongella immobilis]